MLEVVNLSKIYKTKGGVAVKALNNVSLRFPETGMVFLLGKSGSGKSTLLNVCGGLDSPTSGEIIVKGKSSKNFSQSDFDSYRNTFIGFIFQEYNILDEFTVEDNIALALELQGKPKDKRAIEEILDEVDLTGYAKRKPNTLSGGQKQRIAIARALIKSPEIIMADEPTGALDSATGKQVFDTLKKLSKTKLVVVVSHDRDFAEQYGDRIIELKDGEILSDVSKVREEQRLVSSNVQIVGDTLCLKKGAKLDEKDFTEIKNFLKHAEHDVIIASGEHEVKTYKELNRITENGEQEVFRNTDEEKLEKKTWTPQDSKFIRSKLPIRHAAKIGVSSLKVKPVRLLFTVLLCTLAFVFFGVLSTMTFYKREATFKQTLKDSDYAMLQVEKEYRIYETFFVNGKEEFSGSSTYGALFGETEMKTYSDIFGSETFGGIKAEENLYLKNRSEYYQGNISAMAYLPTGNSLRAKLTVYPSADHELCISSYFANAIVECGMNDENGKELEVEQVEDLIGKKIAVAGEYYTVVSIFDSGEIPEKYADIQQGNDVSSSLEREYESYLQESLHCVMFVSENKIEELADRYNDRYSGNLNKGHFRENTLGVQMENEKSDHWNIAYGGDYGYAGISNAASNTTLFFDADKTMLRDGEVVLHGGSFVSYMYQMYQDLNIAGKNASSEYSEIANAFYSIRYDSELSSAQRISMLKTLLEDERVQQNAGFTIGYRMYDRENWQMMGEVYEAQVVGVWGIDELAGQNYDNERKIYLSDERANALWNIQRNIGSYYEYQTSYKAPAVGVYSTLFLPYDGSKGLTDAFWSLYEHAIFDETDTRVSMQGSFVKELEAVDSMIENTSQVFFWVGLVFAIFAALLFSNFISVSISNKKKEIGILRAVGARSFDVFKIFFAESFVISAICILLSSIGSVLLCNVLNAEIGAALGASIFVFGVASFMILVGIALFTAVAATFIPVWNAARKKPVESIRSL